MFTFPAPSISFAINMSIFCLCLAGKRKDKGEKSNPKENRGRIGVREHFIIRKQINDDSVRSRPVLLSLNIHFRFLLLISIPVFHFPTKLCFPVAIKRDDFWMIFIFKGYLNDFL